MTLSSSSQGIVSGYAFIDLGSGTGGSIQYCRDRFGRTRGIGVELDGPEAAEARRSGFEVLEADARLLEVEERSVEFVSAMDFLEHLPDAASAVSVLDKFSRAARHFVFIRHPSFEESKYLANLGLKWCWSDWSLHPNMMLIEDYLEVFRKRGWDDYAIFPRNLATDSLDEHLVPISSPTDTMVYDPTLGPKPYVRFDRPIFGQYDIFIRQPEFNEADWTAHLRSEMDEGQPAWAARISSLRSVEANSPPGEFGFYESARSEWTLDRMGGRQRRVAFGAPNQGLVPFTGNFNGSGVGIGLYDPATASFFLRNTVEEGLADVIVGFGSAGARPICGNWTGSGLDTIGIYVPATGDWYLRYENSGGLADETLSFGPPNTDWMPVVGDWNGVGRDSVGLYDPSTGGLHLRNGGVDGSSISFSSLPGGRPVVGDWDGDGRDSIGIYVPEWGLWVLQNENRNSPAAATFELRGEGTPIYLGPRDR